MLKTVKDEVFLQLIIDDPKDFKGIESKEVKPVYMTHAGKELLNEQRSVKNSAVDRLQHGSIGSRTGTMASGLNMVPVLLEKEIKSASDFDSTTP